MNRIQEVFGNRRVLIPVIHVVNNDQAIHNVAIALSAGADGAMLINHDISPHQLQDAYQYIKRRYPEFWIGTNFLGVPSMVALGLAIEDRIGGLWTDNAGLDESLVDPAKAGYSLATWTMIRQARDLGTWNGLYFGGVAFKYQAAVRDLEKVGRAAATVMDVVTTSGEGTGFAPDIAKIETLRRAIGDCPMAIASGITGQNVKSYLSLCDCFFVATGISQSFTQLDKDQVWRLADIIHEY